SHRNYAERLVDVSRQKLQTLLGAFSKVDEREPAEDVEKTGEATDLTRFYIIAPFAGTVEERHVAPSQRLVTGMPAFVIANTDTLWLRADIRERDWHAITSLREGDVVQFTVKTPVEREFPATVDFLGRALDQETQAVPLVAAIDNAQHL